MEKQPNSILSRFATPSMFVAMASAIIWLVVEVKKVPVIEDRVNKWIDRQTEIHMEFDDFKIETIKSINEVKLSVKDEEIKRLEAEVEFYKNK